MKSILAKICVKWVYDQLTLLVAIFSQDNGGAQNLSLAEPILGFMAFGLGLIVGVILLYACLKIFSVKGTANKSSLENNAATRLVSMDDNSQIAATTSSHDLAYVAPLINSVIKNVINSQFVLKDRLQFSSVLQTPLRESIEQLRMISDHLQSNPLTFEHNIPCDTPHHGCAVVKSTSSDTFCEAKSIVLTQVQFVETCLLGSNVHIQLGKQANANVALSAHYLQKALREILLNAVKHNHNSYPLLITVDTFLENGYFVIIVTDNGHGIAYSVTNMLALNKGNFKVDTGQSKTLYNVTNLSTIQDNLMRKNGSLSVTSARGFLTKVTLRLPLSNTVYRADSASYPISHLLNSNIQAYRNKPPFLVLISSNELLRLDCMQAFDQEYKVVQVKAMEESLEFMQLHKPQCLLIDADCGIEAAIEVQNWLQQSPTLNDIPVLVIGNSVDKSGQLSVLQAGISAIVSKPIDYAEVNIILKNLLAEKLKMALLVEEEIANYHLRLNADLTFDDKDAVIFLSKFNQVLEQHYTNDNFKRPTAAEVMSMTEKTLSRRLSQHYALGFTDVLRKFRLEKAKQKIASGEKVTNTAYDTGFSSPSYFAKCFKSEYGFSPSLLNKKA